MNRQILLKQREKIMVNGWKDIMFIAGNAAIFSRS